MKNSITINLLPGTLSWLTDQDSPSGTVQAALTRYRQKRVGISQMAEKINQMIIDATFHMTADQERVFWDEMDAGTARRCD